MSLFQQGDFTLASRRLSNWKIECDALTTDDWSTLALMAVDLYGHPSRVAGVPRGGLPFARALRPLCRRMGNVWIVDDVFTTGASLQSFEAMLPNDVIYHKVVAFTRAPMPPRHRAVWTLGAPRQWEPS